MQDSLIDQGLTLMLYGMGTVFVFLTILVFATSAMSKIVHAFTPAEAPIEASNTSGAVPQASAPQAVTAQASPQIIEAIKLAIAAHRGR